MEKSAKEKTNHFPGLKAATAIGLCIAVALAILVFPDRGTTPDNPYFTYETEDNRNGIIHVIDDKRVDVPIFFEIGAGIPAVQLSLAGKHEKMPEFKLSENIVPVQDGVATALLSIQFTENTTLKAGPHYLTVEARDTATGRIVRQGEIRFAYNMHELVGKCSC